MAAIWHKAEQIVVTNIISVKETTADMDKTLELLQDFIAQVEATEPGCELFLVNRDDGHFQYVTYEIYANQAAVTHHLRTQHMRKLIAAEEEHGVKRAGNDIHHEKLVAQVGPRFSGEPREQRR